MENQAYLLEIMLFQSKFRANMLKLELNQLFFHQFSIKIPQIGRFLVDARPFKIDRIIAKSPTFLSILPRNATFLANLRLNPTNLARNPWIWSKNRSLCIIKISSICHKIATKSTKLGQKQTKLAHFLPISDKNVTYLSQNLHFSAEFSGISSYFPTF